jgi:hypothetical protein
MGYPPPGAGEGEPPPSAGQAPTSLMLHPHERRFLWNSDGKPFFFRSAVKGGGDPPSYARRGTHPLPPASGRGTPLLPPLSQQEGGPPPSGCMYISTSSRGIPTERLPVLDVSDRGVVPPLVPGGVPPLPSASGRGTPPSYPPLSQQKGGLPPFADPMVGSVGQIFIQP